EFSLNNLRVTNTKLTERKTSKFDLSIDFSEKGNILECQIEYNSNLYDEQKITDFYNSFQLMLQSIIREPNTPIERVNYLSKKEKVELIKNSNERNDNNLIPKTIIELYDKTILISNNKVALELNGTNYTYGQLDAVVYNFCGYLINKKNFNID